MNQSFRPTAVMVDQKTDSLIICDRGSRRGIRWSRRHGTNEETIISDIECWDLMMDKYGDLYVPDWTKHEVKRWKIGETNRTIIAGGNEEGNQVHSPTYLFVDVDQSVMYRIETIIV
jgi:hypothetical protein